MPVAPNCLVVPLWTEGLDGVIAMETRTWAVTLNDTSGTLLAGVMEPDASTVCRPLDETGTVNDVFQVPIELAATPETTIVLS